MGTVERNGRKFHGSGGNAEELSMYHSRGKVVPTGLGYFGTRRPFGELQGMVQGKCSKWVEGES